MSRRRDDYESSWWRRFKSWVDGETDLLAEGMEIRIPQVPGDGNGETKQPGSQARQAGTDGETRQPGSQAYQAGADDGKDRPPHLFYESRGDRKSVV